MHDWLKTSLEEYISINPGEWNFFVSLLKNTRLKPNEVFFKPNEVAQKVGFLKEGILRAYYINEKADVVTSYFYYKPHNNIITLYTSHVTETQAKHAVEALIESDILYIEKEDINRCIQKHPVFERLMRKIAEKHYLISSQRSQDLQTKNAKELYLDFIKSSGDLILKVPQHMIASYLGMSQYTLSKIKKEI